MQYKVSHFGIYLAICTFIYVFVAVTRIQVYLQQNNKELVMIIATIVDGFFSFNVGTFRSVICIDT